MCGLAGWLCVPQMAPEPELLDRMLAAIQHRGPDDRGDYRDAKHGVALGHLRLSIIDLSAASHQPMRDVASGVTLVYNGEIYNFRELRAELQSLGHTFDSRGDTEAVLRSFLQWGCDSFTRLMGMFAIVVWDPRSSTLHLARDPLGMKPLYFASLSGGMAFASEVKAFKTLPGFQLRPSPLGLQQYIEFGYIFDENQTIFEGVSKLPPGCHALVRTGEAPTIRRYFTPRPPGEVEQCDEESRLDELYATLSVVTAQHLVADVPIGLLLSGGLDSSLIAALAARHVPVLAVSMGFADSGVDERLHARRLAEYIGANYVDVTITPQDVMDEVTAGAWVFDDLFADWGTLTTRLMYRRCRERGIKVVLVGEGADELFGGYDTFRAAGQLRLWQQFRLYQQYSSRRHGSLFSQFRHSLSEYLETESRDAFEVVRQFESTRQLPNNYLMKVDKASMAEGVEARAPYLDRRVAELAWRTPREWLLRNGENKYLLRELGRRRRLLPPATTQRAKFGASIASTWMDDHRPFRQFARERVLDGTWAKRLALRPAMIDYFDNDRQGYAWPRGLSILQHLAWRLLLLEMWAPHYMQEGAA